MVEASTWVGPLGFAAFGVVGIIASARDDLASTGLAVVASVLAVLAGSATLWALLRVAATGHLVPTTGPARAVRPDRPTDPHASAPRLLRLRRGGRRLRAGGRHGRCPLPAGRSTVVDDARAQIQLPAPTNTAVPPSAPAAMQGPGVASFPVDGLTPYIIPADRFYRIDTALTVPQVNVDTWSMKVSGMVDNPFELTFADLLAMPQVQEAVTLSCVSNEVGGDLVGNAIWQGVPLRALLDRAGVQSGATQIVGRSVDGFTAGFPTAALDDGRTALVAVGMNGAPLPAVHGFPARLVIAGLYGYVSATKWLSEIRLTTLEDVDGYWIPRGLGEGGTGQDAVPHRRPQLRSERRGRHHRHRRGRVGAGPTRGITKVEVQVDDGDWVEAKLGDVLSDETWREWMVQWDAVAGHPHGAGPGHRRHRRDPDVRQGTGRSRRRHRLAHPPLQGHRLTA